MVLWQGSPRAAVTRPAWRESLCHSPPAGAITEAFLTLTLPPLCYYQLHDATRLVGLLVCSFAVLCSKLTCDNTVGKGTLREVQCYLYNTSVLINYNVNFGLWEIYCF